ncbi:MAG TPA: anti-sigma factor [Gemmatimonadales bacterium]|nr:anti-sigma factor [Gemmatimonadales bacterium]
MSTPDDTELRDLAAAYVLGALAPEEARAFEAYLASSPEARREVAEYRETAALLALGGDERRPPPELRARVQAAVAATRERPLRVERRSPWRPIAWVGLAAAVLAAVGLGARTRSLGRELAARDSTIAELERRVDELGQGVFDRDAILAAVLSRDVRLVQLTASGNPDPAIQIFWDTARNTALVNAIRLKPPPTGRTYQLWWIRDGKPVPSVTFDVRPDGAGLVRGVSVPSDGVLSAAAVTEEPSGGSQQPTSPILLVGTLPKS